MKIKDTLYFDHQATTPLDPRVFSKMSVFFADSFGNPHSSDHTLGWESSRAIEKATAQIARLIGADADEIIFTSGATEANNFALLGLGRRAVGNSRCRLLLSAIEHKSVLAVGRVLGEQHAYLVEEIPVDSQGVVEMPALEDALDDDVLAVSVMAVNNEIGTMQKIEEISRLVKGHGAVLHCDAAQAPVATNIATIADYADVLSLSSHKMYGPKGVGVTYVAREFQKNLEPLIYGGGQQNGLRSGTIPVPLCVGMGMAAELLVGSDAEKNRRELRRRRDTFIARLCGQRWPITLNGPKGAVRHPGNANLCFRGFDAHHILAALQPRLSASTGAACASGIPEPSHVLSAIGLDIDDAESSIRFSLGFDTSDADVDEAVGLIHETLGRLAKAGF